MIILGHVEPPQRLDVGVDRLPAPRLLLAPPGLRGLQLLRAAHPDRGAVLLRVGGVGGLVALKERVQQGAVADPGGIVGDLDGLGVIAEVVVGRIRLRAAGVADAGAPDAR